jgi:hypothetical protein
VPSVIFSAWKIDWAVAVSIQGAPQRRPLLSSAPGEAVAIDRRIPITRSLAEQITPVLTVRLGNNGIAGVFCALAPSLNDRLDWIVSLYDLKASHGRECWLWIPSKSPNHLVTRKYDMGRALDNLPTAICLTAEVGVKLWQWIELPTTKLIGARSIGREKDPSSQELGQQDSALV